MSPPRLSYFSLRGRAEAIRLLLYANGIEFEDHRVDTADEWTELKPTLPFGGLPIYESGGLRICQSHAILRHLGSTLASEPISEARAVELDTTQEVFSEAQEDYWRFAWVQNYYDHLEKYSDETLTPRLENLARWFRREGAGGKWWVGDALSYVDCIAFAYLDEVDAFFPAAIARFSELSEFCSRFASQPGISKYLVSAERPIVFGMGAMGPKIDPRVPLQSDQKFISPWMDPLDLATFLPIQRRLDSR